MIPTEPTTQLKASNPHLWPIRVNSPEGVPEEECGSLTALVGAVQGGTFDGGPIVKIFWELGADEVEVLKNGGLIELAIYNNEIPMTAMNVVLPS